MKVKPPDNRGNTAPVSKNQRIWSRKDLTRDGSTSGDEKAKILAHTISLNNDKTWRESDESKSLIPRMGK